MPPTTRQHSPLL
ncbi:hypothetical protein E2C01_063468 [Portunus trituberculatus]|uniref:Uncharacterized protein n=1 Tax=Portunus trituberculatus TaxID=210409 RepID=A0A5B7HDS0_PORTR|nr:hypothetical protein [Portunus trituberculatus]